MGCIEIFQTAGFLEYVAEFNRNMGCIEIWKYNENYIQNLEFNRNMGCIEIAISKEMELAKDSLIETWDVLKLGVYENDDYYDEFV